MRLRRWQTREALPGAIRHRWPRLAMLVAVAVMTGACGHGLFSGNSSSSSSGGGGGGTTRSLYVTNFADGKLSSLSNSSGVPGSPVTIGAGQASGPAGLAATSKAVYVANTADNMIHEFAISSTGNLSTLGTIAAGTNPQQVVVTSNGSFAYAINQGGSISQYVIGTNGGLTSNGSTTSGLITPVSGVASSSFLYVTGSTGGTGVVLTFAINSDGTLASGPSSVAAGGSPSQITMDTSGLWVFVGDATSGVISVLQVMGSSVKLAFQTLGTGSPAGGLVFALPTPTTAFLYVANPNPSTISIYPFNTVNGVLSLPAIVSGLSTPNGLAVDSPSSATALFAANTADGTISGFTISSFNGGLTFVGSSATENPANNGSSPQFIAVNGQSG
jgi:6-phosphogluconolactonase (cycloisomerase 2 family)